MNVRFFKPLENIINQDQIIQDYQNQNLIFII